MHPLKNYPERILMTADCIGGVWTYALDLCRKLSIKGIEVALAVMGSPLNENQKNKARKIPGLFLYESDFKLEWMDNPWNDIHDAGEWLKTIEINFEPDIIHLNSFSFGVLDWNAPVVTAAHSDVFSWWNDVKRESPPAYWNDYRLHVQTGLFGADLITAPSFYMLSALERNFGSLKNKKVIYNGRDKNLFYRDEKHNFVFASGRIWDEAKNLITLVKASPELKCPVYIAGENNHPVNGRHFEFEGINFTGKLSQQEISKYLSHASVFVHPAKYEPFGLAPLEAAYSGCALVISNIPSLREIWKDNALYFNPDNEFELAEIVNELISNESLLKEYSYRAYMHSLNYSAEKMFREYLSVYAALIRNKNTVKVKYA